MNENQENYKLLVVALLLHARMSQHGHRVSPIDVEMALQDTDVILASLKQNGLEP